MAKQTKIQWTDSTVNPVMGCRGCELWRSSESRSADLYEDPNDGKDHCYAAALHRRYGATTRGYAPRFDIVTPFPGRMAAASRWSDLRGTRRPDRPWLDGYPRMLFVSDMGDALSSDVTFDFLFDEIIATALSPLGARHTYLWLTKRASRMVAFAEWLAEHGIAWPANVWPGTSLTSTRTTGRIAQLRRVGDDSTVRFLSIEPQLERLALRDNLSGINWVIQGGESGEHARPFDVDWARRMRDECVGTDAAYFLKQLGANVLEDGRRFRTRDAHGGDWSEWPADLRVRQMPRVSQIGDAHRSSSKRQLNVVAA